MFHTADQADLKLWAYKILEEKIKHSPTWNIWIWEVVDTGEAVNMLKQSVSVDVGLSYNSSVLALKNQFKRFIGIQSAKTAEPSVR